MTTIQAALQAARAKLAVITDQSALEAEILLAHVLDKPRSYLRAFAEENLSEEAQQQFAQVLQRRLQREPIAYITGKKEFWSLDFIVTSDTLIPRPETELLVETILTLFPKEESIKVADLGTGSGAIAIAIAHERPMWQITAVDVSENALQIARNNAQQFALNNVSFCHSNWCTALPATDFDVIVSNPPYIAETEWEAYAEGLAFEPTSALVSGTDGLDAIREISQAATEYLKPGGYLLMEHGFWQGEAVRQILLANGYKEVHSLLDLSGQERATMGQAGKQ